MTNSTKETPALLEELLRAPPETRFARFVQTGGGDDLLCAFGDEAERLALVEVTRALTAAQLVVDLADEHGTVRPRARARRALAQALAYAGRHADALAACHEAVAIGASEAPIEAGRAQIASLHPLGELGRYEEAIAAGNEAYDTLTRAGAPEFAARADFNLGNIHQNRHDPQTALFHFDRAAPAFADSPLLNGYLQSNRGEALLQLNDFAGAEQAFTAALAACESAGAHVAAAIAQGNLADLEARRGRLSAALHHFEHARSRLEADQADSHAARLLGEQAEALETLGMPEDARSAFAQAITALDQHGLAAEAARARHGLGRALLRLAKYAEASTVLLEARRRYRELGQTRSAARVDLLRSEAALADGKLSEAEELLTRATSALRVNDIDRIALLAQEARVHAAAHRKVDALNALSAALADARALDIPPLLSDLLHQRAILRRQMGDEPGDLDDLERAIAQAERVRGTLQAEQLRAAVLSDRLTLYHDLIDARLRAAPQSPERVFEAVEQARGRTLLEALGDPDAERTRGRADGLERRRVELRAELSVLYSRLADERVAASPPSDLAAWRGDVAARERGLDEVERRLATRATGDPFLPRPAELEQVRAALSADGALIEFFITRDVLHALVVTPDGVGIVRDLIEVESLQRHVQQLQFQIDRGGRPGASPARAARLLRDVRVELRWLDERIIAPCLGHAHEAQRVCFVPAGPLHAAPLHAAWNGSVFLIERVAVHYAPSASIYARLTQRAATLAGRTSPSRPLVVGVNDEHAPEIEAEAHELAEQLSAQLLWAGDATVAAALAALPNASLAHIACHGYFSRRTPRASGLRLADRWLTAADLAEIRLSADLVTLSGCSTGRNVVQSGEEIFGLIRGFLSAGVPSALVTQWPAHDVQTRQFMRKFYTILLRGERTPGTLAAGLREAMQRRIAEVQHPYFWAPFLLVGLP